jgi:hypothetical protein
MKNHRFRCGAQFGRTVGTVGAIALVLLVSTPSVHAAKWTPLTNPSPSPSGR